MGSRGFPPFRKSAKGWGTEQSLLISRSNVLDVTLFHRNYMALILI